MALDLPKKTELVVYHGMSALQKKYYKALLMKDPGEAAAARHSSQTDKEGFLSSSMTLSQCVFLEAFGNEQGSKNRLLNILMNLRKCVDHPYLFDGEM